MMKVSTLKIVKVIIWGANMLIRTTTTHLGDCFLGNILKIFSKNTLQKNLLKFLKFSLYYFVKVCVKISPKIYVIFKKIQVHL